MTLTTQELTDARAELSQAQALVKGVKITFMSGGYIEGARLLNDIEHLLDDGLAALDKQIGGVAP